MSRSILMLLASVGIAIGIVLLILGNLWIGIAVIAVELLVMVPLIAKRG